MRPNPAPLPQIQIGTVGDLLRALEGLDPDLPVRLDLHPPYEAPVGMDCQARYNSVAFFPRDAHAPWLAPAGIEMAWEAWRWGVAHLEPHPLPPGQPEGSPAGDAAEAAEAPKE